MTWDNGITYKGEWRAGKYHGIGSKLYSRGTVNPNPPHCSTLLTPTPTIGGGYRGAWVDGKRQGKGCHLFAGKFGYDRWEGPFEEDQMDGMGSMFYADGTVNSNPTALQRTVNPNPAVLQVPMLLSNSNRENR